jgi:hypothetical protein
MDTSGNVREEGFQRYQSKINAPDEGKIEIGLFRREMSQAETS